MRHERFASRYIQLILVLLVTLMSVNITPVRAAGLEAFDFTGKVDEDRFKALIVQLRCLVCQNQSLADSDAELAHDLRREIYEMMDQGKTDKQIVDFLVARYGEFVLYKPRVEPRTWILWYGPFGLLVIGLLVLMITVRKRKNQRETGFSEQEQQRLNELLGDEANPEPGQEGDKPA